jgi:hypothetical protein
VLSDSDREQAGLGAAILHRLVPAPDHGAGFRRDPETGFVYYSSEWLSDKPPKRWSPEWPSLGDAMSADVQRKLDAAADEPESDAKTPE